MEVNSDRFVFRDELNPSEQLSEVIFIELEAINIVGKQYKSGGGFFEGGFGVKGAVEGMAIANVFEFSDNETHPVGRTGDQRSQWLGATRRTKQNQ